MTVPPTGPTGPSTIENLLKKKSNLAGKLTPPGDDDDTGAPQGGAGATGAPPAGAPPSGPPAAWPSITISHKRAGNNALYEIKIGTEVYSAPQPIGANFDATTIDFILVEAGTPQDLDPQVGAALEQYMRANNLVTFAKPGAPPQTPAPTGQPSYKPDSPVEATRKQFAELCYNWHQGTADPEAVVRFYQQYQADIPTGWFGLSLESPFIKYIPDCQGLIAKVSPGTLRKEVYSLLNAYKGRTLTEPVPGTDGEPISYAPPPPPPPPAPSSDAGANSAPKSNLSKHQDIDDLLNSLDAKDKK